jgi:peroxiredoxin Q/BCP
MKSLLSVAFYLTLIFPLTMFGKDVIDVGAIAPTLTVVTDTGDLLNLEDVYAKGPTLIYFYPKSDTPGCTKQACNIRDNFESLGEAGINVIGVSIDSVKSQAAFKEKYNLPFTIIADEKNKLGKAFGVGSYLGVAYKRQSFLIKEGKVIWRDLSATPASQASDALAALNTAEN